MQSDICHISSFLWRGVRGQILREEIMKYLYDLLGRRPDDIRRRQSRFGKDVGDCFVGLI